MHTAPTMSPPKSTGPSKIRKILLLYSGGLDTSCLIKWLQEHYEAEIATLTVDLGQGGLEAARAKAHQLGVQEAFIVDAREEFAQNYIAPLIKANGLYQDQYPLSTAVARPLIAKLAVEYAHKINADAVAHGCTGKGNDQVRFDISIQALDPALRVLAPVREWNMTRDAEIAYAKKHGIPVPVDVDSPYSTDENMWGRSIECGVLEHPDQEPPPEIFSYATPPEQAPERPAYVELTFEEGLPVALDGKRLNLVDLILKLNEIAGRHGVGIIDMTEDRVVGLKSREIYECPAAVTILTAHRDLERFCCTIHENEFKPLIDRKWAELVYKGLWYDPLMEALNAYINKVNERVTGTVRLKLYKGHVQVVGRQSPNGLYDLNLATYDAHHTFNQMAAPGFIEIWGLPTRVAHRVRKTLTPTLSLEGRGRPKAG
ncbi:MAG: argininosuccinate synthase [Candidatus Bipolaricaulota bacterium]|nr:argininosuccinate synthase [Candidatus Bipolaricaulota bacterium]MCS7274460.1 argininosuccinate synthase [Candidatus Bipolaricaulota bacterium]MDW8110889.1 argininosuccinate synthase [Candidatus Bipolaricaulota bacterium]MDW8329344.1 argininosuccinate synthase [Candidatus Bipolaricaulota bacterium]